MQKYLRYHRATERLGILWFFPVTLTPERFVGGSAALLLRGVMICFAQERCRKRELISIARYNASRLYRCSTIGQSPRITFRVRAIFSSSVVSAPEANLRPVSNAKLQSLSDGLIR